MRLYNWCLVNLLLAIKSLSISHDPIDNEENLPILKARQNDCYSTLIQLFVFFFSKDVQCNGFNQNWTNIIIINWQSAVE